VRIEEAVALRFRPETDDGNIAIAPFRRARNYRSNRI